MTQISVRIKTDTQVLTNACEFGGLEIGDVDKALRPSGSVDKG